MSAPKEIKAAHDEAQTFAEFCNENGLSCIGIVGAGCFEWTSFYRACASPEVACYGIAQIIVQTAREAKCSPAGLLLYVTQCVAAVMATELEEWEK